jgi:hypothetical protein
MNAEGALGNRVSCIAKSVATTMNVSSSFWSNDVGVEEEITIAQEAKEIVSDEVAHIRGEANSGMNGDKGVHSSNAPHPHWNVNSRTASFIYEVKVTHSYVWEECRFLSLCAGCLITEVTKDVVRNGNW